MYTTLKRVRRIPLNEKEWFKLLIHLRKKEPDEEPLPITTILESKGFDVALECLITVKGYVRELGLYDGWCREIVKYPVRGLTAWDAAQVASKTTRNEMFRQFKILRGAK